MGSSECARSSSVCRCARWGSGHAPTSRRSSCPWCCTCRGRSTRPGGSGSACSGARMRRTGSASRSRRGSCPRRTGTSARSGIDTRSAGSSSRGASTSSSSTAPTIPRLPRAPGRSGARRLRAERRARGRTHPRGRRAPRDVRVRVLARQRALDRPRDRTLPRGGAPPRSRQHHELLADATPLRRGAGACVPRAGPPLPPHGRARAGLVRRVRARC